MAVLVCGLNPSIHSAEAGVGFVTGSNRFWPGARAAGLVSADRDTFGALIHDGVGMTDLVKRATRRADELDRLEYQDGFARVERLVAWLRPRVVCFVGLSGWRVAVDSQAKAGLQNRDLAGRPVYVMPSTSGLNAHCQLPDVIDHLVRRSPPRRSGLISSCAPSARRVRPTRGPADRRGRPSDRSRPVLDALCEGREWPAPPPCRRWPDQANPDSG